MAEDSQEVKLAVAVNDITWMKQTMTEISAGVKSLQQAEDKYAKKEDLEKLQDDIAKLKLWRSWITGGMGAIVFFGVLIFEYGKQWFVGGK